MFRRAIVASDFSKESIALVNTSGGLKEFGTVEILLLQFWGTLDVLGVDSFYKPTVFEDFEKNLQKQKAALEEQGFIVETRVLEGLSASQVNKIAIDENYSLISVGSDRHIFGSMANELIHNAERPTYIQDCKRKNCEGYGKRKFQMGRPRAFRDRLLKNSEVAFNYLVEMIPLVKRDISCPYPGRVQDISLS